MPYVFGHYVTFVFAQQQRGSFFRFFFDSVAERIVIVPCGKKKKSTVDQISYYLNQESRLRIVITLLNYL